MAQRNEKKPRLCNECKVMQGDVTAEEIKIHAVKCKRAREEAQKTKELADKVGIIIVRGVTQ